MRQICVETGSGVFKARMIRMVAKRPLKSNSGFVQQPIISPNKASIVSEALKHRCKGDDELAILEHLHALVRLSGFVRKIVMAS